MADLRTDPAPGNDATPRVPRAKMRQRDAPSVQAIHQALGLGGRMTAADLRQASDLPRRTIYRALRILREDGLLLERGSLHDTRQTYYWLAEAPAGPGHSAHLVAAGPSAPTTAVP